MTSPGGEVVGGEVTCGGEMVGGESSWWRDDWIPCHHLGFLLDCIGSKSVQKIRFAPQNLPRCGSGKWNCFGLQITMQFWWKNLDVE